MLDIHLRDTYFVFTDSYFAWFLAVVMTGFFLLYLATNNILFSKKLTWIHVVITLLGCALAAILTFSKLFLQEGMAGMPRRYYDYGNGFASYFHFQQEAGTLKITTITFIFGQLLYIVNLLMGLIKMVAIKNYS